MTADSPVGGFQIPAHGPGSIPDPQADAPRQTTLWELTRQTLELAEELHQVLELARAGLFGATPTTQIEKLAPDDDTGLLTCARATIRILRDAREIAGELAQQLVDELPMRSQ